ncbi:NUDIX domain-containing protein [Agrococcus baldri]|uniref:NUDIX domain-containing protein n=1 Tax=Agrococcus baldri TaxID=153730 RepID=A0AA94KZD7_9MICO|nr:NUDIX domain-containing protein [Agrococcus baldri]SFS09655.1 NUDIX domain-containing protein [Agrococcus baldri]
MTEIRTAATLVLLRDGAGAIEVLLLQRPDRGHFAGGWVFPGGKVEPLDRVEEDPADAERSEELTARNAAVRETAEETGLIVAPEALVPLSQWSPPQELAVQFHTWFFIAEASEGEIAMQPSEVIDHMWIRPADALKRHGAGDLRLFPPTWVTLDTLLAHPTVDAALQSIEQRELRHYMTRQDPQRGLAMWDGDEAYDGAPDTEEGPRHRLHVGSLPWRFEHR